MNNMELLGMPGFQRAMQRVDAWFHGEVLDRPPVRFSKHNAQYESVHGDGSRWPNLRDRWMDAEYQVESFLQEIEGRTFRAETFPVYWPNLGPEIYAAFFGCELEFGEITSWSHPIIADLDNVAHLNPPEFDPCNPYLRKLREMTLLALERCDGRALVGITSWCPGIDCVAAWRGPEELCMDLLLQPEWVKSLLEASLPPFHPLLNEFHGMLRARGLPTVSWMGIPAYESSHIAQADFSNMISPAQFEEFCLPPLRKEIAGIDRVIFHVDGRGVANHLEHLLAESGITALQWVQGVGADEPILQWIPLIKRIQAAGKPVVVDIKPNELEPFMAQVAPNGIFLCISAEEGIQEPILKKILKWR